MPDITENINSEAAKLQSAITQLLSCDHICTGAEPKNFKSTATGS